MTSRIEIVGKRHRISYAVKTVLSTIIFAVICGAVRTGPGNALYDHLTIGYLWSAFVSLQMRVVEGTQNAPNIGVTYEKQVLEDVELQVRRDLNSAACIGWVIYLIGAFLAYSLICCILDRVVIRIKRPLGKVAVRLIFFIVSLIVPPVLGILFSNMVYGSPLPQFIISLFPRLASYRPDGVERAGEVLFYIPVFGLFLTYALVTIYNLWMLATPAYIITDSEEARSSLPQRLTRRDAANSLTQRTAALEEKVAFLAARVEDLGKSEEETEARKS